MTARCPLPFPRMRLAAGAAGVLLALTGCGSTEPDQTLSDDPAEVEGGAVGPDVRLDDDVGLQQVQLEYPLDGVHEAGEDARLFMAVTNTGGEPVTLTDISGPDFGGVRVETAEGQGLPLTVDAEDTLYVGAEGPPDVTLLDLGRELRSSQSIPVTFTFGEAGEVTVDVPVSAEGQNPTPPFDFPDDDPDQDPTEDGTSTSSPTT
ncbi:Copper(I)-binding protein [Geodermatophilus siccatus]|uniref:Copper(I)-binding protein n=1 Tax=Geodermatophilus siccatus TaxID=1137991 RepID=A0A1G9YA60_9ACTN|nr:copper chaperone PCu(A)C [Geodermatophilus siccatus]SDN06014.1 Copper(I)-binding protein [Geodermatophilus siccatus]